MRKLTLLLAIAAIAAAPSLATAKATKHAKAHHARVHHAKMTKVAKNEYKDPNANTWRLFGLIPSQPAPKAKKK
jgi:hypothetical protein